jgi:hypothetical protein
MANLYTAPRSRPVMYTRNPLADDESSKDSVKQASVDKWTGASKKLDRVVTEQIPVLKKINPIRRAIGDGNKFVFPGVQTIKWQLAREITEQYGLQSYTILPWYTKAVAVTITGKAYLGAFATDITASNGLVNTSLQDKGVVEYMRSEMLDVDQRLSGVNVTNRNNSMSNMSLLSTLSVGVDGEAGSI